jgi:UDP-glucose 4-epimerase
MSKVVVTGGDGFIGSHLIELLQKDHQVYIVEKRHHGGIENRALLDSFCQGAEYIYHLGAEVGFGNENYPWIYNYTNITGTCNVLQAAVKHHVKGVVFASSAAVYQPQSAYAISKLAGEYYCRAYGAKFDLPVAILRFFNVYGPRQNLVYGAVIPNFIKALIENESPIITGDGTQTRDFIYVKDVCQAMISSAGKSMKSDVGTAIEISVNKLYSILYEVGALEGKQLKPPIYLNSTNSGIKQSKSDNGQFYITDLQFGLLETLKYYQQEFDNENMRGYPGLQR